VKILCTGDVHIGRSSTRFRGDPDARALSCAGAWSLIVDRAIAERVDLVAVSGDLVDRANRYFEAYGPLERGLERLKEAGIRTVAVAGNHDFDVLPGLVTTIGDAYFRLLGADGRWERLTLSRDGATIHLDGWSFPREHHPGNPLTGYDLPDPGGAAVLGLLHCDVDQTASRYAPVALAELRRVPASFWLLGHIHRPTLYSAAGETVHAPGTAPAIALYPGSPHAMDPGETGPHGAWLLELEPGAPPRLSLIPLSRVRYDVVQVDVTGAADLDAVQARLVDALRRHLELIAVDCGPLRYLSVRARLVGRTPLHRELADRLPAVVPDLELTQGEITAWVERCDVETRPAIDLEELARTGGVAGELARLLLALGARTGAPNAAELPPGDDALGRLLADARRTAESVRRLRPYAVLPDGADAPDTATLAALLERQAWMLLDTLLAQKDGGA